MEIFFQNPDDIPLPPDQVRIVQFDADPYPDGQRVRVYLEITPFQQRPDAEISITNQDGDQVASVSIIETIDPRMELTLHLRASKPAGLYTVSSLLFYRQPSSDDQVEIEAQMSAEKPEPEITIVDQAQIQFHVP